MLGQDDIALSRKGEVFNVLNQYDEALKYLNKSLKIEPDDTFALSSRGDLLYAWKEQ